ncbi:DMT family transporter [Kiloniella sp. b19]|uniref:DMT family transporter n=1 Tax=Kiloniella sp. GXU_MW_B19 TaxID=3141326 RepID=UPI0031D830E8
MSADQQEESNSAHNSATMQGLAFLLICPLLMSSNAISAKVLAHEVPPSTLALGRWLLSALILLPFVWRPLRDKASTVLRQEWKALLVLGATGMGVCGAFVYKGAETTTATNIGLIYAFSPIAIIGFGALLFGERLGKLQVLGIFSSFAGVLAILSNGALANLTALDFTSGDLWIAAAAVGWAVYSLTLRHSPSVLGLLPRFAVIMFSGVLVLLPFSLWELAQSPQLPSVDVAIPAFLFLALIPSLAAFLTYGRAQELLGSGPASLVMYLLPLYNVLVAWLLLDEQLEPHHVLGAGLILPGLYLASRRKKA